MRREEAKVVRRSILWSFALLLLVAAGCGSGAVTSLNQLEGKVFAVPQGTVADQLVLSRFPEAKFKYYASALEACMAVKQGEADAAAYDQPILKNIAAKNDGLMVLSDMITVDDYGFAVALDNQQLKATIDQVVHELKANGTYDTMLAAWLPEKGAPVGTQSPVLKGTDGVLIFGTAAVTEPFSYLGAAGQPIGFDIDLATYVADRLGYQLQIINMDFGDLIPALAAGGVDMIGACITITDERAKSVLFSEPYYRGGIAALVKE
jgi:polar amino acid transport system substrate-binding protein